MEGCRRFEFRFFRLWTWRGKVGRAKYTGLGVFLFAIKHNLDRVVASSFGYHWGIFNYWVFSEPGGVNTLTYQESFGEPGWQQVSEGD